MPDTTTPLTQIGFGINNPDDLWQFAQKFNIHSHLDTIPDNWWSVPFQIGDEIDIQDDSGSIFAATTTIIDISTAGALVLDNSALRTVSDEIAIIDGNQYYGAAITATQNSVTREATAGFMNSNMLKALYTTVIKAQMNRYSGGSGTTRAYLALGHSYRRRLKKLRYYATDGGQVETMTLEKGDGTQFLVPSETVTHNLLQEIDLPQDSNNYILEANDVLFAEAVGTASDMEMFLEVEAVLIYD